MADGIEQSITQIEARQKAQIEAHNAAFVALTKQIEEMQKSGASVTDIAAKAQANHELLVKEIQMLKHAENGEGIDGRDGAQRYAPARVRKNVEKGVRELLANPAEFKVRLDAAALTLKGLFSATQTAAVGAFAGNAQTGVVVPVNALTVNIRALFPAVPSASTGGAGTGILFSQENATNNAAIVATEAVKPESTVSYTPTVANYFTVAHIFEIAEQTFRTAPWSVEAAIFRMSVFLSQAVDNLLLNDATHGLLAKLTAATNIVCSASNISGTGVSILDAVITTIQANVQAQYPTDAVLLNRAEYNRLMTLKDANGQFMFSPLTSPSEVSVMGARVIRSDSVAAGLIVAGSFAMGAAVYETDGVRVDRTNSHADRFAKNMVTLRLEEELAFAVYNTAAFVRRTVTFV